MSIRIMSAVFENETLKPTEKLILLALADHADDTGRCYPSIGRLAKRTCLSERALQTNIRSLEDQGYIRIQKGGGRENTNVYFVKANPAGNAPLENVNPAAPALNPAAPALNPAAYAPEPSITIKEPSVEDIIVAKPKSASGESLSILCDVASRESAESFIAHRKAMRKPLSPTGAKSIAKTLGEIFAAGFNPDDALTLAEERGWLSIKADWFFKEQQNDRKQPNRFSAPIGSQSRSGAANQAMLAGFLSAASEKSGRD